MDSRYYLAPSFDLNNLSAPHLRTILVELSIPFSTSASKEQLINAITEKLLPKYKPLLGQQIATVSQSTSNQAQALPARVREKLKQTTMTSPQPPPPRSEQTIPILLPQPRPFFQQAATKTQRILWIQQVRAHTLKLTRTISLR